MSVLSKALCLTILVSVVPGCAVNTAPSEDTSRDVLAASSTGDRPASETSGKTPNSSANSLTGAGQVASREQLAAEGSGLGIELERGSAFSRVLLKASGSPEFDVMTMSTPPRLVLDLIGSQAGESRTLAVANDPYVKGIRVGRHADRARIVFDLTQLGADQSKVDQLVDEKDGKISITFTTLTAGEPNATSKMASAAPAIEEKAVVPPAEVVAAKTSEPAETLVAPKSEESNVVLGSLNFSKNAGSAGTVTLGLNKPADFQLQRTTATEYSLKIAGAKAAERTTLPQISPRGSASGIRSARAVNAAGDVVVRMFVDGGVDLVARVDGSNIVVNPVPIATARTEQPYARAQLKEEKKGEKKASDAAANAGDAEDTARKNPTGGSVDSSDGSKQYHGRLISLDLQDTDIDNALRIIAEVSNLNIIASEEVTGKVTLRLIDVPWDQALDVILKTNGLDQVTEGNVVRIAPVDKLRQEREALLEAKRAAVNLEDLKVAYIRVSYARVADLKEQVEAVLSERGSVTVDERTNQLIIKDVKAGHLEAESLIHKLDLRTPQVLLETEIVEAQRDVLRDLGFQWNYSYVASPETGNATGAVFPNSVSIGGSVTGDANSPAVSFPAAISATQGSAITAILDSADGSRALTARLSALETEGKVKVISRPQVATVNNKEAEIKSVETIRVKLPDSGTSVATGAGASASGGGSTAVEKIDVGIELKVTPQASPDYYVLLDVNAKSSTFGSQLVDNIPSTLEREATSTILVKSGQTFALGGVYRIRDKDSIEGVPWLKDIPVLGTIFRRTFLQKADEELIFFITPHIVEGSFDQSLMKASSS